MGLEREEFEKYFKQGTYAVVRPNRFDSRSEGIICLILNRILKDYDLGVYMQIRLTPQQALDNYVEVKNEQFKDYYENRHKWMKFDFIFEEVYEFKGRMNYIPVAIVEFDGPYHNEEKQQRLDAYKDGIVSNIGAAIVRIGYSELDSMDEVKLRERYENEIMDAIIKGYFTKTISYRKTENLVNENNIKKFNRLTKVYEDACKKNPGKAHFYTNMLVRLHGAKELGFASPN